MHNAKAAGHWERSPFRLHSTVHTVMQNAEYKIAASLKQPALHCVLSHLNWPEVEVLNWHQCNICNGPHMHITAHCCSVWATWSLNPWLSIPPWTTLVWVRMCNFWKWLHTLATSYTSAVRHITVHCTKFVLFKMCIFWKWLQSYICSVPYYRTLYQICTC